MQGFFIAKEGLDGDSFSDKRYRNDKSISKDQMYKNARCEFFDKKRNLRH